MQVKADLKKKGHVLIRKARIVVQHSKKGFPDTAPNAIHATVARTKNIKYLLALAAHIHRPYGEGDVVTALTIYLEFPKCLGLPDSMVFEMLIFMEGFQTSNTAFDARLNAGLLAMISVFVLIIRS